jgi:hypothetical protein
VKEKEFNDGTTREVECRGRKSIGYERCSMQGYVGEEIILGGEELFDKIRFFRKKEWLSK